MTMRAERRHRSGVIGHPVARVMVPPDAATVLALGVGRRHAESAPLPDRRPARERDEEDPRP